MSWTDILYNWLAKHPDQKSTLPSDCSYTLEVPYSGAWAFRGDVLRFGADAEMLAPKSLLASVMKALRLALGQYNA